MKTITSLRKLLSLALLLVFGQLAANADSKLYFNDFSIAANDELEVKLQFDTDADDIKNIDATIVLPEGLSFVDQGTNEYAILNEDRISGMISFNYATGSLKIKGIGDVFTAEAGSVATFKFKASDALAASSEIVVTDIMVKHDNNTEEVLGLTKATVTRTDAAVSTMTWSLSPATASVKAGETVDVEVLLANPGTALTGLQATLKAAKGLTIEKVEPTSRIASASYNATTGKLVYIGNNAIPEEEGAILKVTLKGEEGFSGSSTLTISDIAGTTVHSESLEQADLTLSVNVLENGGGAVSSDVTFNFDQEAFTLRPGDSKVVEVFMNTELNITMLKAKLILPNGITAAFAKAGRAPKATYNAGTGVVAIISGIKSGEGSILKMTLTATEDFKATDVVQLSGFDLTTGSSESYEAAAISLTVNAIDAETLNALKAEIENAKTLLGEDDTTAEPGKSLSDAIAAAQAVVDNPEATTEEMGKATEALKEAEEAYNSAKAFESTFPGIVKKALDAAAGGAVTVALDKDYDFDAAIEIPAGKQLEIAGNGHKLTLGENGTFKTDDAITLKNVTIDAAAQKQPLVQTANAALEAIQEISAITFDGVTINGMQKALFYSAGKNYLIKSFVVNNSIIEVGANITVFDFTKGSVAMDFKVAESTIYAKEATGKAFFSSQGGEAANNYGATADAPQYFRFLNSTLVNLAKGKNFFSLRSKGQKWMGFEVKNNIFVTCGKSGQTIKGMNDGQSSANPIWDVDGNSFNYEGTDTSASEDTGDADEPVKNSVAGVVEFADAVNGDFTIGASTIQAREKTGDPRWLQEFVAPTDVDKTALESEIATATELLGEAATDADPGKALADAIAEAKATDEDANVFQNEVDAAVETLKAAEEAYKTATGISTVKAAANEQNGAIYNLNGVRVTNPAKGVYIQNGKKVVIK